jgi:hypothetical protein
MAGKHMGNPFRDWVDDSKAFGQAACAAYTRAWQAVEAIESGEPDALILSIFGRPGERMSVRTTATQD